jgi:phage baseplate assembly protein W
MVQEAVNTAPSPDLLIMKLLSEIEITGAEYFKGNPPYLVLTSLDFSGVEKVLVNGFTAPEFMLTDKKRMVVQLPAQVVGDRFRSLRVLRNTYDVSYPISLTDWSVGKRPKFVTGFMKMTQNFLRLLLQTPGTDILHPEFGGGLLSLIGQSVSNKQETIASKTTDAIMTTQTQFKALQSLRSNIDPGEKLVYARLQGVQFSPELTMAGITMSLVNSAGQTMITDVTDLEKMIQSGTLF